jgi:hypothetical protein
MTNFRQALQSKVFIKKFYIVLFLPMYLYSQSTGKSFYEIKWAFFHPVAAMKVKKIYRKATAIYKESAIRQQLDNYNSGGKLDAYRHVFFMAAFAQKVKTKKLRKLGIAHEKYNYKQFLKGKNEEGELPDSLSSVMDLHNNEIGFEIGRSDKKIELKELSEKCIASIKDGKALIFKRDLNGKYLTCEGKLVEIPIEKKSWGIKKCLINSSLDPT